MPVSYIFLVVMKLLKERNILPVLTNERFKKVMSEFIAEVPLSEEVMESFLQDYDYEYSILELLDTYAGYVTDEDGMLTMSPYVKIETLSNLIEEEASNYDDDLICVVDDFFEFNVQVFDIIGINIEKDMYTKAISLERDIELGYDEMARAKMCNDKVPNKSMQFLKKNIIKRNILLSQLRNSLSLEEYNDLQMYSSYMADLLGVDSLTLKIENEGLEWEAETDPFYRSLFFLDTNKERVFAESFYASNKYMDEEGENRELFYTTVLDVIDDKTSDVAAGELDDDLVLAKYRLMYAMDMIFHEAGRYDYYLFMNKRKKLSAEGDCSFIERDIFYFIDEIFEYTDEEMINDIGIDYENTIKVILIEAYYELTKDKRVIEAIKNHPNYGRNHFVTGLFDNLIKKSKKKLRKKEDE